MKRRTGILIVIITIMGLAGFLIYSRKNAAKVQPAIYQELLAEYERAVEDLTYTREQWGNDIYEDLRYYEYVNKYPVRYCIKDLNGDGREELLMGFMRHEPSFERFGTTYMESCEPNIIYTYEGEDIRWSVVRSFYAIKLYKGGIVELISRTGISRDYYMYYQAGEEYKKLDTLAIDQKDGEMPHYYKYIQDEDGHAIDCEEVTEEEFHAVRNRYATLEEELDWKPLEGFWEPETILSLDSLGQRLKGNIRDAIRKFMQWQ